MKINPQSFVGIEQLGQATHQITVFPNPAKSVVTIRYVLSSESSVKICLTDVLGNQIRTFSEDKGQLPGIYDHTETLSGLSAGLYLIKTTINGTDAITKFLIIN